MEEVHELIAAFREINGTRDRSVARFSPALIGMFGSVRMFNIFLANLDEAFTRRSIPAPLRERAINLYRTFIPQVAGLNGIGDISTMRVSPGQLRAIRSDSPQGRTEGVQTILAALMTILGEAQRSG